MPPGSRASKTPGAVHPSPGLGTRGPDSKSLANRDRIKRELAVVPALHQPGTEFDRFRAAPDDYCYTLPTEPPNGAVGNGAVVPFDAKLAGGKVLMGGPTTWMAWNEFLGRLSWLIVP
jgi:hypothetical protein